MRHRLFVVWRLVEPALIDWMAGCSVTATMPRMRATRRGWCGLRNMGVTSGVICAQGRVFVTITGSPDRGQVDFNLKRESPSTAKA
jgi:hypothetical protein